MARAPKSEFTVFLLCNDDQKTSRLSTTLKDALKDEEGSLILARNRKIHAPFAFEDLDINEFSKADLIAIEATLAEPEIFYGIGSAQTLGKPIAYLFENGASKGFGLPGVYFEYKLTKDGLEKLKSQFKSFIRTYTKDPTRFKTIFPYSKKSIEPTFIIDLDKLEPREFDNLCFELVSQMGFKKVNWGTEMKEFDVVGTLTKKDPDEFEYEELWFIVTGNNAPSEQLLDITLHDPEILFHRLERILESPNLFSKYQVTQRRDTPITILFILREKDKQEVFDRRIERAEGRLRNRRTPWNIRIRTWDENQLLKLIQRYPQIAFKYFSEESRIRSKYRKSPEELYNENIQLTEQVLSSKAVIEEEKRKRFIAERETAWKDVAFKAAHKLGNPVDATDTFLQSLKRKLNAKNLDKAIQIADEMDHSIEEAKSVIGQFKSLTRIEEINALACDILPIIQHACKTAEEQGVTVSIQADPTPPKVFIDAVRVGECFHELVANSLHWFDKEEKRITVTIKKASKSELLEPLDSKKDFLRIKYEDNGCGVPIENKEKIFSPFFSTYQHGTGLGLSIVKKVMEKQDGWVLENGEPSVGASFDIFVPIDSPKKNK
ncbi:MAG: sensor histidine kinase [Bacteroidota bacterium]